MENRIDRDEQFELWWLLVQTTTVMSSVRSKELAKYNLTQAEASVVFVTHVMGDETRPIDLALWAGKKRHTITSILAKMVKSGRVRKIRDPRTPKVTNVALTDKGNRLVPHVMERESIHKMFDCLSGEELEQLRGLLLKLRERGYEESGERKRPPYPPCT